MFRKKNKNEILIAFVRAGTKPCYAIVNKKDQHGQYSLEEISKMDVEYTRDYTIRLENDECYDFDIRTNMFRRRGGIIIVR